jgi:NAD-dependent deacetylase
MHRPLDLPPRLAALLDEALAEGGRVVAMTGAGISAESGIPTFRGPEGYWQVGSRNYHPHDLATRAAFSRMPEDVWAWYLYRRGVCRAAEPNAAHRALVELEAGLGDRLLVLTQNVDGLHHRAGQDPGRVFEIHGNIDRMRCARDCHPGTHPIPEAVALAWDRHRPVGAAEAELLICPVCGGRARPHVLWFDECYDEAHFRFESSLEAATEASLLLVIGTSGATNLPHQVANLAARRGAVFVAINLDPSPFTELAERHPRGCFAQGRAGDWVPRIVDHLLEHA